MFHAHDSHAIVSSKRSQDPRDNFTAFYNTIKATQFWIYPAYLDKIEAFSFIKVRMTLGVGQTATNALFRTGDPE